MSKGILVHAFNNEEIDYVKQACMVAERAKKYLNLPTSVITDCKVPDNVFDKVIDFKGGDILIFPSNFMYPHKVEPVIEGTRYSYISWLW